MQQPTMMAQIVLNKEDQPTGVALMFFGQNLGGAIFVSVAQNVFTSALAGKLAGVTGLHLDKAAIVRLGATSIKTMIARRYWEVVVESYRDALCKAFLVGTGLVVISMIGAVLVDWKSTKESTRGLVEDHDSKQGV